MLTLHKITKSYYMGKQTLQVLKGIDLHIDAGELVAIMGKSGSGKSTLMNIIGLLDHACSGDFTLNNRAIQQYNDDELSFARNELIGFVFQSFHLLSRQSVLENVMLPLRYRRLAISECKQRALAILDKVGMADRASHFPNELSGGQRQRAAIARALVGEPQLILADEPTGALDEKTSNEIMHLFSTLNEQEGITVVIITHDPSIARRCKRTVTIKDGRLNE